MDIYRSSTMNTHQRYGTERMKRASNFATVQGINLLL